MRVIESPVAIRDLDEIFVYLVNNADQQTALRFLQSTQDTYNLLADYPGVGTAQQQSVTQLSFVHRLLVPQFTNYLIFYQITDSHIYILRILHGARDVESILTRL